MKISIPTIIAIVGLIFAVAVASSVLASDNVPWYPQDEWKGYDLDHVNDALKVGDSYSFKVIKTGMEDTSQNGVYDDTWTIERVVSGGYEVSKSHDGTMETMSEVEFLRFVSYNSMKNVAGYVEWHNGKNTTMKTACGYRNILTSYGGNYDATYYHAWYGEDGVLYKSDYSHRYTLVKEDGSKYSREDMTTVKLLSCNFLTKTSPTVSTDV